MQLCLCEMNKAEFIFLIQSLMKELAVLIRFHHNYRNVILYHKPGSVLSTLLCKPMEA